MQHPDSTNLAAELAQMENRLEAFEVAWLQEPTPSVVDFVANADAGALPMSTTTILELIAIDLEHRWRAGDSIRSAGTIGCRPKIKTYVAHLPQLARLADLPGWILTEEYRVRQLWGDAPNMDRFLAEYPDHFTELAELVPEVERELAADGAVTRARDWFLPDLQEDPRAPLRFDDYLLETHLGSGAMGKVYRATQHSLQRQVAIKALRKSRQEDPLAVEQFLREARLVGQLDHPNIVQVHGVGRFPGGGYFLAMQLVAGQDLAAALESQLRPIEQVVTIVSDVAEAIHYAHEQGVVHCDLKPANVLRAASGRIYVTDFGFAQLIAGRTPDISSLGGTFGFMAPEQLVPERITPAVDVYGLGALLYSLLTNGRPLPNIESEVDQNKSPHAPVNIPCADMPDSLDRICKKCLQADPDDRYRSADEFLTALSGWNS